MKDSAVFKLMIKAICTAPFESSLKMEHQYRYHSGKDDSSGSKYHSLLKDSTTRIGTTGSGDTFSNVQLSKTMTGPHHCEYLVTSRIVHIQFGGIG